MPAYRFYWFGEDDHIKRAADIECATDADALLVAKQRIGAFPTIEVWRGTTRVARLGNDASSDGDPAGL